QGLHVASSLVGFRRQRVKTAPRSIIERVLNLDVIYRRVGHVPLPFPIRLWHPARQRSTFLVDVHDPVVERLLHDLPFDRRQRFVPLGRDTAAEVPSQSYEPFVKISASVTPAFEPFDATAFPKKLDSSSSVVPFTLK